MLLVPFASNFCAYSATFNSISRSFLRRLSSISVIRGTSVEEDVGSSALVGESSLTEGLRVTNKFPIKGKGKKPSCNADQFNWTERSMSTGNTFRFYICGISPKQRKQSLGETTCVEKTLAFCMPRAMISEKNSVHTRAKFMNLRRRSDAATVRRGATAVHF